jgi:opacity protein-like surface antigen
MAIVTKSVSTAMVVFLTAIAPATARAQDERLRISFIPAAATVAGDAELALGGSFGYRFSERFWFEGDFTWIDAAAGGFRDREFDVDVDDLAAGGVAEMVRRRAGMFGGGGFPGGPGGLRFLDFSGLPGPPSIPELRLSTDGSTVVGTIGIRYELPVQTERFRPYLAGGLGINNTDQEVHLAATSLTPDIDRSISHTGYAFNAGAGASFRLVGGLWADVDAKYFRLSSDRHVMRLGGGASFRF